MQTGAFASYSEDYGGESINGILPYIAVIHVIWYLQLIVASVESGFVSRQKQYFQLMA